MRNVAFDNEEFKQILRQYEESVKTRQHIFLDADDLTDIADYYFTRNKLDKAEEVSRYAASIHPDSSLIKILQANTYLNINDDIGKAKAVLADIDDKDELEFVYTNADIMLREHKTDEAIAYLSNILSNLDGDEQDDFILDVAELLLDNNDVDHAREWLKRCQTHGDDYHELQARILFDEQKFDEVIPILNELLNKYPYEDQLWCLLAKAYFFTNNIQEALNSCDFAIAVEPEGSEAEQIKAYIYYSTGNPKEAIKNYNEFLKWHPGDIRCHEYLGYCYLQTNQYGNAVEHFERVLTDLRANNALDADIFRNLAFAYSGSGNLEKAIENIDNMLQYADNVSEYHVIKGHIYLENNHADKAWPLFEKAITNADGNPDIVTDVALALYENDYIDFAHSIVTSLMFAIDYAYPKGEACLALLSYHKKDRETYLKALRRTVELDPSMATLMLEQLFPPGTPPESYYDYALNYHLN